MSGISKGVGMMLSIAIHVGIIALLFLSLPNSKPTPEAASTLPESIEATAVDDARLDAEVNKLRTAELAKKQAEEDRQQRLKDKAQAQELRLEKAQQQRMTEEKQAQERAKIQQQKQKELAQKRTQETEQLALLKKQQAAEKEALARIQKAKAEAEKQRKVEEKRLKEQAEKRKAEAKKREQEKKRKAALAKKKQQEAESRKQAEQDLRRQLAQEAKDRAASTRKQSAIQKAINTISNKVERYWVRPATVDQQLKCVIRIKMMPGGEVISAQVIKSSGNPTFDRSAELAVRKASPLPVPENLFQDFRISDFPFSPR